MTPFAYHRARDVADALSAKRPGVAFLAGGTDLMQLHKVGVARPQRVVDIGRLPLDQITVNETRVVIGALSRMSDVAADRVIRAEFPLIAQALLASASPQVRNMATLGGNLLQRTRCAYFRSADLPCNKRDPGSGCGAREGENRGHAIFGGSLSCVATHPSDLAVALVALDSRVRLRSAKHERVITIEDLYSVPENQPERDTVLAEDELIVAIEVPVWRGPSVYLKVRDRASFEFAVVSVAVALRIEAGRVLAARVVAGGVGTRPWRLRDCEFALVGGPAEQDAFRKAAQLAGSGAIPLRNNSFKVEILEGAVRRALEDVGKTT